MCVSVCARVRVSVCVLLMAPCLPWFEGKPQENPQYAGPPPHGNPGTSMDWQVSQGALARSRAF